MFEKKAKESDIMKLRNDFDSTLQHLHHEVSGLKEENSRLKKAVNMIANGEKTKVVL